MGNIKLNYQQNETDFSIQGFTEMSGLKIPVFLIFLFIYLFIILGNMTIFVIIVTDCYLHTPMYIFLMNLSLIDITSTSDILPKLLNMLLTQNNMISFLECVTQMYFFLSMACAQFILLAAMAYDRYIAICHPLHYAILMGFRHIAALIIITWTVGLIDPLPHAFLVSKMAFCVSHVINHLFCDLVPLLKLSCSDTSLVEKVNYIDGALIPFPALVFTFISYVFIISAILKIKSVEGRRKAFSTCSSHLLCVTLYYLTTMCLYMRPTSSYSPKEDKYFALLYIVVVPMLNPVIYSLKNQEVKKASDRLKNKFAALLTRDSFVFSC
ncbi:olfactory receptor 1019-like [Spea bombifrons]|uniref:olfactory receptor 1019-like n=1 Tax=Spea bombifrons TaxID=233779 RepID=UPI00234A286D|nr:olfactory receptor 1019-like [Spea bombifrons]